MVAAPALEPARELPPRYYRDNFLSLCRTVQAQYGDLLHREERDWLAAFEALEPAAQCLYVRLVSRVGPWFRLSSLDYPEIGALTPALETLSAGGFVASPRGLEARELGRLYTRAELLQRFPGVPGLPGSNKVEDLAALEAWAGPGETGAARLLAGATADGESLLGPSGRELVQVLQLLFFGNRRQSLTDFVLSDLGVARYYPYRLDRVHRLFRSRASVDDYLACGRLADEFQELRDAEDAAGIRSLAGTLLEQPVVHRASERRWWRLCNRVARQLEREGELELALRLYRRSALHPSRERAVRVLEARAEWSAAIAGCREILAAPWGEEEREAAQRMLPRLQRRSGRAVEARPRDRFARLDLELVPRPGSVEGLAAEALGPDWAAVHYVENALFNSLFGLAFWEQIFAPVDGAFHNPFQRVPADMYDGGFASRRQPGLEQRLDELAEADLAAELGAALERYQGYDCRWLDWQLLSPELLNHSLSVIPGEHLLAIWRRQLFDPLENRRGFPDLLALGETPGNYCLVEVKGPGDSLQDSQKRWLRFFGKQGIPATVAWVRWIDD